MSKERRNLSNARIEKKYLLRVGNGRNRMHTVSIILTSKGRYYFLATW